MKERIAPFFIITFLIYRREIQIMFSIKTKKKNLIEVDEETLFLLRTAAKANAERLPEAWETIKEGDIVRHLVDKHLVPQGSVLYERVMHLVTEARLNGEKEDYRIDMSTLFDFARVSKNLNQWDIKNISEHISNDLVPERIASLESFDEYNTKMSAREIVKEIGEAWEKYQYRSDTYSLINELLRIEFSDNPVKLFDVMEWYTIVTIRPFETNESEGEKKARVEDYHKANSE